MGANRMCLAFLGTLFEGIDLNFTGSNGCRVALCRRWDPLERGDGGTGGGAVHSVNLSCRLDEALRIGGTNEREQKNKSLSTSPD
ncbi:hypothetical protein AAFF_G00144470 [Aldrovandia affinis]|uniref:Uncharacterized protein n=1 Tax=Aldrovandia affinis TaxID=143900 RepID=A0AAD7T0W1_9TELE|nr:hypothetical protein AAFF_G00144470 [Aldrovandia affinis]